VGAPCSAARARAEGTSHRCGLDLETIRSLQERLIRENQLTEGQGTVYLQITRGAAPRTHHFPPKGTPATVFLSLRVFARE
jgi:hypothetical protein